MAGFELWDTESRNLMADFDTEGEALAAVSKEIQAHGLRRIDSISLVRVGPRGGLTRVAAGAALVSRVLRAADGQRPAAASPQAS